MVWPTSMVAKMPTASSVRRPGGASGNSGNARDDTVMKTRWPAVTATMRHIRTGKENRK